MSAVHKPKQTCSVESSLHLQAVKQWTCYKSHLFHHMRSEVKTCRWQGTLISGVLVFISGTCKELSFSLIVHNLAAVSLQGLIASIPCKFQGYVFQQILAKMASPPNEIGRGLIITEQY